MRKSQIKQALLSALCGPLGLCYISVKAALLLSLTTLLLIFALKHQSLLILFLSLPISIFAGAMLVRSHNKKLSIRDFSLSTYIGRVSCQVIGKTEIKSEYHKLLTKARWKNRVNAHANTVLGIMCIIVSAFIAMPNLIENFTAASLAANENTTEVNSPSKTASTKKIEPLDNGRWQIESSEGNNFTASLKADEYQDSSDGWYRPTLKLACINNKTNLIFSTSEILGTAKTNITLSFDGSGEKPKPWKTATDYRSAIAPAPISLTKKIRESDSLTVSYQTFGTTQKKAATFKLSDSQSTIKSFRKQCSW